MKERDDLWHMNYTIYSLEKVAHVLRNFVDTIVASSATKLENSGRSSSTESGTVWIL